MAQQTAVDWFIEQLVELDKELDGIRKSDDSTVIKLNPTRIYDQAKQMEKEQIQDAWNDGNFLGRNGNLFVDYSDGKGYYKSEFENK